jgi:hypothetical protein
MNHRRRLSGPRGPLVALLVGLAAAGCGGTAAPASAPPASASPASTPSPSATPGGASLTEAQAVALVLAQDPRFARIGPTDPNLIGQSAWYEVSPAAAGWRVTVTKGWGDCQAGCINRHTWVYDVDPAGAVTLVEERGDPLGDGSVDGTGDGSTGGPGGGTTGIPPVAVPAEGGPWITGRALAGPVCPVERIPADPACADRPVAGAELVIRDAGGAEVARATTAADGTFLVAVPGGGAWTVEPQPVAGLLGTAPATVAEVADGPAAWAAVEIAYDTGIR